MIDDWLVMQESLFYQFRLADHVPADHLLRTIDRSRSRWVKAASCPVLQHDRAAVG